MLKGRKKRVKILVTGGAGFIGSHVVDRGLADGHDVVAVDNLSTGRKEFIQDALAHPQFSLVEADIFTQPDRLTEVMAGCDVVFHLAANADVRFGLEHPRRDLEQNTIATFNVLEAMRANGVRRIAFSSTGSVYGESSVIPTPEDAPFPVQTSLYAASKLPGEAMIQAYCEGYDMQGYIFRFVSLLGERYSHGHVFDFLKKLTADPNRLHVLGDGHQKKSYLYVGDCIDAMFCALSNATDPVNIFNLGTDEYVEVNDSIRCICDHLGVTPELDYAGGERGWIGDNPFIFLDCQRIRSLGWAPTRTIRESIVHTVDYLRSQPWLLEARS